MGLQAIIDQDVFNFFPKINSCIDKAESFEANQMQQKTLQRVLNMCTPLDQLTTSQVESLESDLIEVFKFNEWLQ